MSADLPTPPRPLNSQDVASARALVHAVLGRSDYEPRVLELLRACESGAPDVRCLVSEAAGIVVALAIFGPVAGTSGAWQLRSLLFADGASARETGRPLIQGVVDVAIADEGRLVVAELPADPVIGRTLTLLRTNGFRQVGRIPDYFRDGVALLFLRRDLTHTILP